MPAIDANLPRKDYVFAEAKVSAPVFFAPGHALTADQAAWASKELASTIGNGFGGDIRRAIAKLDAEEPGVKHTLTDLGWDMQSKYDERFAAYEFSGNSRSPARDAAEAMAFSMAENIVAAMPKVVALGVTKLRRTKREDGRTVFTALVDQYLEKHPELLEQAKAVLAAAGDEEEASDELDLSDTGGEEAGE
jgi:hypothetical protein